MIAIGVDYGTTTSWVARLSDRDPRPLLASMRSALFIANDGNDIFFGNDAVTREGGDGIYINSPKNYVVNSAQQDFEFEFHYSLDTVVNQYVQILLNKVEGVQAENDEFYHITVTIPNCYNGGQMRYMYEVFKRALSQRYPNFELYLLPEPIAAALHYVVSTPVLCGCDSKYLLVCDIGGGTTDLALIYMSRMANADGKYDIEFKVVTTEYDGKLGGNNIDSHLYDYLFNYNANGFTSVADDYECRSSVVSLKETLSSCSSAEQNIVLSNNTLKSLTLFRNELEQVMDGSIGNRVSLTIIDKLASKMLALKARVNEEYRKRTKENFNWSNVVLLPVGGTMRIPCLREKFRTIFSGASMVDLDTESRETFDSVVYGAMYYSAIRGGMPSNISNVVIEGRTCHPISVEFLNGRLHPIVRANMPDGEYRIDTLRPLSVDSKGNFIVEELRLYLQGEGEVAPGMTPDFIIPVKGEFAANGRDAENIPIVLILTIKHSLISKVKVVIENINSEGGNFEKEYSGELIAKR